MNNSFKVNYLSKNFSSIRKDLRNYAKRFYGDKFADTLIKRTVQILINKQLTDEELLKSIESYKKNIGKDNLKSFQISIFYPKIHSLQ